MLTHCPLTHFSTFLPQASTNICASFLLPHAANAPTTAVRIARFAMQPSRPEAVRFGKSAVVEVVQELLDRHQLDLLVLTCVAWLQVLDAL